MTINNPNQPQPPKPPTVKLVQKRAKFASVEALVRLQLMLYCFTKEVHLTEGDYRLLTHVAIYGYDKFKTPQDLLDKSLFCHKQSVRNTRKKLLESGFLIEKNKHYFINPEMEIEAQGIIVLEFKAANL